MKEWVSAMIHGGLMRSVVLSVLVAVVPVSYGADLVTFNPGDPIRSGDINANFSELANRDQQVKSSVDAIDARVQALESQGSGSVVQRKLILFVTSNVFTGGAGRKAMSQACAAIEPSADFCYSQRLSNAQGSTGVDYTGLTSNAWIDNGSCSSWTSGSSAEYAYYVLSSGGSDGAYCSTARPALCCY